MLVKTALRTLHCTFRVKACFNSPAVSSKLFTAALYLSVAVGLQCGNAVKCSVELKFDIKHDEVHK